MAPKTLDGSAFSFTTTRGHTTHISILWVFVLFCFFTVAVVVLGGEQKGLVERQFPDTKVHGDLEVTDGTSSQVGLIAPSNVVTPAQIGAFTADYNRLYLLGDSGGAGTIVTLPAPRVNSSIRFLTTAVNAINQSWVFGTATNPQWATGSTLTRQIAGIPAKSPGSDVPASGNNILTISGSITGAANGGGGVGTTVDLFGVEENGEARWLVTAFSKLKGTGANIDLSSFGAA